MASVMIQQEIIYPLERISSKSAVKGRSCPMPLKNRPFRINSFTPHDGSGQIDLHNLLTQTLAD